MILLKDLLNPNWISPIFDEIIKNLDVFTIFKLSRTCKQMSQLLEYTIRRGVTQYLGQFTSDPKTLLQKIKESQAIVYFPPIGNILGTLEEERMFLYVPQHKDRMKYIGKYLEKAEGYNKQTSDRISATEIEYRKRIRKRDKEWEVTVTII